MNHLQLTILNRLSKGPAIPPQLWLNALPGHREQFLKTLHELVRSGHVHREDKGESHQWYIYSLTDKGARWIKRKGVTK